MQDSRRPSINESPERTLKTLLKEVVSSLEVPKQLPMCMTSYLISRDGSCGLVWDEMSKEQGLLRSNLSSQEINGLVTNPFVEVRHIIYLMYRCSWHDGLLHPACSIQWKSIARRSPGATWRNLRVMQPLLHQSSPLASLASSNHQCPQLSSTTMGTS